LSTSGNYTPVTASNCRAENMRKKTNLKNKNMIIIFY